MRKYIKRYFWATIIVFLLGLILLLSSQSSIYNIFDRHFSGRLMFLALVTATPFSIFLLLCLSYLSYKCIKKEEKNADVFMSPLYMKLKKKAITALNYCAIYATIIHAFAAMAGLETYNRGHGFYTGYKDSAYLVTAPIMASVIIVIILLIVYVCEREKSKNNNKAN